MKKIQIEAGRFDNDALLRQAGVKRIHAGWYTVWYNGVVLDGSNVNSAKRNRNGEIRYE